MMSLTHITLSVAITSLSLSTADPILLLSAALASQIPDIDTSRSKVGRLFKPVSKWLEKRFPHRTVTHSILATVVVAMLTLPIALLWLKCWLAIVLGYFCGWFGDIFTKQGVAAFYPSAARAIAPGNPRFRLSTGSNAELFVLAMLVVAVIVSTNINSSGGILRTFNQTLGIPSGAVEIVNAETSLYLLTATISGWALIIQQPVNADFEVVKSLTQSDLLVKDKQGQLYRVGTSQECQIIANRIAIHRGQKIRSRAVEVLLKDRLIAEALAGIPPKLFERTYINGTLTLQDAEDLEIPTHTNRFDTLTLQPSHKSAIVRLESASPAYVAGLLGDYYATGNLTIRTVEVL